MAIKYKELKEKIEKTPLSEPELKLILEAEEYIDSEIEKQFDISNKILIDLCIATFGYSMKKKATLNLKTNRKELMQKELEKRYKEAGWRITLQYDEWPSLGGTDYWVLKGK